jgi:hypothetical protein
MQKQREGSGDRFGINTNTRAFIGRNIGKVGIFNVLFVQQVQYRYACIKMQLFNRKLING